MISLKQQIFRFVCPVFKIRSLHPTSVYLTNCLTAHNQLGSRDWLVYTTAPRTRRRGLHVS